MMTRSPQNSKNEQALRFALPKKGRLKKDFATIMENAGLASRAAGDRLDYGVLNDDRKELGQIEILNQRCADAIDNLDLGIADMAIVGLDTYEEKRCEAILRGEKLNTRIVNAFNVSACGLYIAAPAEQTIKTPQDLEGKRIATSYPNALRKWLNDNNVEDVKIIARDGGIEDYVRLGVADVVCDVVDTGGTLKANGLVPSLKLFDSTAVLIQRTGEWEKTLTTQASALQNRLACAASLQDKETFVPTETTEQNLPATTLAI